MGIKFINLTGVVFKSTIDFVDEVSMSDIVHKNDESISSCAIPEFKVYDGPVRKNSMIWSSTSDWMSNK